MYFYDAYDDCNLWEKHVGRAAGYACYAAGYAGYACRTNTFIESSFYEKKKKKEIDTAEEWTTQAKQF